MVERCHRIAHDLDGSSIYHRAVAIGAELVPALHAGAHLVGRVIRAGLRNTTTARTNPRRRW